MKKRPAKRKSTGKRLRFEIFARDGFRCRYCGRESSEVQLVLDHVKPVCQGGETIAENLITSCSACNAGKAGKTIPEIIPTDDDRLRREQEMREQERALRVATETAEMRRKIKQEIVNFACERFGVTDMPTTTANILTSFYNQHGAVLFRWIEIAASRGLNIRNMGPYVSGIRRRAIEEGAIKAPEKYE